MIRPNARLLRDFPYRTPPIQTGHTKIPRAKT